MSQKEDDGEQGHRDGHDLQATWVEADRDVAQDLGVKAPGEQGPDDEQTGADQAQGHSFGAVSEDNGLWDAGDLDHARSTALAPSRPCGRNTRTRMSSTKAQTSFQAGPPNWPGMYCVAMRFDDAQHQATDDSARHVADAAENRRGERLEAGREPHSEVDVVVLQSVGNTGHRRERGAERERDHDDAVHVDPHQASGVRILGHGLHAPARLGAVDEVPQEGCADQQGAEGEDRRPRDGHATELERGTGHDVDLGEGDARLRARQVEGVPARERYVVVVEADDLLKEDRDADGGDQRSQPRGPA